MSTPLVERTTGTDEVHYPSSDGKPLGETGPHVIATLGLMGALKSHLAHRADVYVASNMFLYYEQGNPRANRAPDCMVIFGVRGNHERRSFKTWVEGAVPAVIFEMASDDTFRDDLGIKRDLYDRLGVGEYYLFDPLGDCLNPRLLGFRLENGRYVPMVPNVDGGLTSAILDLRFVIDGMRLRPIDLPTGQPLPLLEEGYFAAARAARELEQERLRAEQERQRADEQRLRAEQERQRADRLDGELRRLRARLQQPNPGERRPESEG